jgi:hypothetical protein
MAENGSKPTFDFSKVNRQWNRDFARTLTQAARVQLMLQREPNDEMEDAAVDALFDRQEQALTDLEALADEQAALLVQVLAEVPAAWLLPGAPDNLDWSKVESLDCIQADRYAQILDLLRTKNIAGDDSKNSDGHSRSRQKRRGR